MSVNYAPQNVYCVVVCRRATRRLRQNLAQLAKCLDNVVVVELDFLVERQSGRNLNAAHIKCLQATLARNWRYALIVQVSCAIFLVAIIAIRFCEAYLRIFSGSKKLSPSIT
jgi:hypothetical protein